MRKEKPNIVFIICDDLCPGDLSCYGNPHLDTPNLDSLFADSARLSRYRSGPLCSPARASIMTGKYHYRTRVVDTYCGRSMMDPGQTTLAHLLAEQGYATGIFGKWHLGDCYPMRPQDMGFSETLWHLAGGISQPGDWPGNRYFDPVLMHNGKPERFEGYCADIFTDHAIDFIRRHAHEPFFAYVATNTPHSPFEVDGRWTEGVRGDELPEKFRLIYGMIANIDWNVGRILDALHESGVEENTIVIFTSDHGPCTSARVDGRSRYNCNLRGIKGQLYEGGVRVPHFWRWPGVIPGGVDLDYPANPIDVLPTLMAAAGGRTPADVDGLNLLPLLRGDCEPEDMPKRMIFMQWHRGDAPVKYRNCAVICGNLKWYSVSETEPPELYDLAKDPYETTNLAGKAPAEAEMLREAYERWYDEVSSTFGEETYRPPWIVVGSPASPHTLLTRQDWRMHGEDGWTDDHYGHWELEVLEGRYEVRLTASEKWSGGKACISFGGRRWELPFDPASGRFADRGVALPGGRGPFEAWIECEGERRSVRYVDLLRQDI